MAKGAADPFSAARAHVKAGRLGEALAILGAAFARSPLKTEILDAIADLHGLGGDTASALACRNAALALSPSPARSSALAAALMNASRFEAAVAMAQEALAGDSNQPEALQILALATLEEGKAAQAAEAMRRVVSLSPRQPGFRVNLGKALWKAGDVDGALAEYRAALDLAPDSADAHYSLALLLLALGRLEEGWDHYRQRRTAGRSQPPAKRLPARLEGKRFLIQAEQGLGDELTLLRFARVLAGRGAKVGWRTGTPRLLPLLRRLDFLAEALGPGEAGKGEILAAGDLPWLLGETNIPAPVPLSSVPERVQAMQARLEAFGPGPYIGVTWRAGTPFFNALSKAVPAGALAYALKPVNASVVVLQRLPEAGEIENFAQALGRPVFDASAFNDDLDDMLALLSLLDDHIAVSNTNVHLSASLGRPARILVCWPPDFRWPLTDEDGSPWYPGMRTYRQLAGGDWTPAMSRLVEDLGGTNQPALDRRLDEAQGLNARGRHAEAFALCRAVLDENPDQPGALRLLASVLLNLGRMDEAALALGQAATLTPDFDVHRLHACALAGLGRWHEATAALRAALAIRPDPQERSRLAAALLETGDAEGALAEARRAAAEQAGLTSARVTEGAALMVLGRAALARAAFETALDIEPGNPVILDNFAQAAAALGDFGPAEQAWNQAIAINPTNCRPRGNLALMHLSQGRLTEGWANYRFRDSAAQRPGLPSHPLPADLSDYVLLVEGEQGLGDELFLLRFIERLRARGGEVLYRPNPKLASMLERAGLVTRLLYGNEMPEVSARLWSGDLPFLLGEPGPFASVRLTPRPDLVAAMQERLAAFGPGPHVGITWRAGNPAFNRLFKEVPPAELARALSGGGAFSPVILQRHPEDGEVAAFARALGRPILDMSAANDDLEAMLALLSLLDDHVAVSNTNIHLSAALSRPARILLPHPPEFRWMAAGDASPWFPDMRLYRQKTGRDWGEALERLAADFRTAS